MFHLKETAGDFELRSLYKPSDSPASSGLLTR
jgi:hypothetical protein